jgi:hypothetical protein
LVFAKFELQRGHVIATRKHLQHCRLLSFDLNGVGLETFALCRGGCIGVARKGPDGGLNLRPVKVQCCVVSH